MSDVNDEERVEEIECPWCEAVIAVPVSAETKTRLRACPSAYCHMPIQIVEKGRWPAKTVRVDRGEA